MRSACAKTSRVSHSPLQSVHEDSAIVVAIRVYAPDVVTVAVREGDGEPSAADGVLAEAGDGGLPAGRGSEAGPKAGVDAHDSVTSSQEVEVDMLCLQCTGLACRSGS